jgi:hypothetical protein
VVALEDVTVRAPRQPAAEPAEGLARAGASRAAMRERRQGKGAAGAGRAVRRAARRPVAEEGHRPAAVRGAREAVDRTRRAGLLGVLPTIASPASPST